MSVSRPHRRLLGLAGILILGFSACTPIIYLTPTATVSIPSPSPTSTPEPMALIVNDEGLPQAEFDAELDRYLQSMADLGVTVTPEEAVQVVQDEFIVQMLLAQSAVSSGYAYDEAALQARIDALSEESGGAEALAAWMTDHGYTEEQFRTSLRRQVAAAWMRDQVIAEVPSVAEQVHIRQILFYNESDAQTVYEQLQAGWDFATLADQYAPLTKGELGWFPRGYLVHPTIEEAAFALQPGQTSPVVASSVGWHILYLVERDPARPLSPDALLTLQEHALMDWLTTRRNESTIVLAP
jgi:parvulin-like peptidyl-prolyl isomerase